MTYIIIFLAVVSFVAGFLLGAKNKLLKCLNPVESDYKKEDKIKKQKKDLKDRFTDDGDSFSDLLCEVEGTNEQIFVEENRKKQNKAYNYIKESRNK